MKWFDGEPPKDILSPFEAAKESMDRSKGWSLFPRKKLAFLSDKPGSLLIFPETTYGILTNPKKEFLSHYTEKIERDGVRLISGYLPFSNKAISQTNPTSLTISPVVPEKYQHSPLQNFSRILKISSPIQHPVYLPDSDPSPLRLVLPNVPPSDIEGILAKISGFLKRLK
ncbi:MAG: hypothetical protein ACK5T0_01460 [Vampirovibrionales bacterium]